MKKNIKIIIPMIILVTIILSGCFKSTSNKSSNTSKEKIIVKDLKKSKETNKVDISLEKVEYISDKDLKKNERLVNVSVSIKNNNNEDFGVGSGDFQIITNGKTYESIGTKENFGDVIKSKDTLEGTGSYVIPSDVKKGKIVYSPVNPQWADMKILEWSFTIE